MRLRFILTVLTLAVYFGCLCAQNVGIGNNNPLDKLHVSGFVRSSALANTDTNLVVSDFNGRLVNLAPGTSGQVLKSQGPGRAPVWGPVSGTVQVYNAYATRTSITTTTFTQIIGLTQTVTLTAPATVLLNTYGSLETFSSLNGGSGTIVQLFNNGVAIGNAFQTHDINDAAGFTNTIAPWSFGAYLTLPAGTYTFSVRARKYAFDNFYAGGNTTAPNPNEGALTVMVIY
jgi:hypothetical protein